MSEINLQRRKALRLGFLAAGATVLAGSSIATAQEICGVTPAQTKGPFYPVVDQTDKDTDLITIQGRNEIAKGEIIIVQGTVTDLSCRPLNGALVEIWQACASGKYNHPADTNTAELDPNFQYWGRATTDQNGNYKFRTIIPGAYPADVGWTRPPHIHFKIQKLGYLDLITQMYFEGEDLNDKDLILKRVPKNDRKKVVVSLQKVPLQQYRIANFNITLEKP